MLLFQTLKLMPVLFQHGCLHLKKGWNEIVFSPIQFFFTWSFLSVEREPQLIMLSRVRSAISSRLLAAMSKLTWSSQMLEACSLLFARCFLLFVDCLFMSRPTVPFNRRDLSSKREWRDKVATWGLLHRFPPSSTSSSNFTHLGKGKICSGSFSIQCRNEKYPRANQG